MTSDEIRSVFISPILHEGARQSEISKLNSHVGCFLPQAYIDLMMRTNGVEGFVSHEIYVILWPVEHILDLNVGYGVSEFAPGFFLFGSNGGDAGYVFDTRRAPMQVLEIPCIDMSISKMQLRGNSFEEFIVNLRNG